MWHRPCVVVSAEAAPPSAASPSQPQRRLLTAGGLMVAAALVAVLVVLCRRVGDPDFWWHLETGEWILDHGALPGHELFTYTVSSHAWVDQEYGNEILIALLFRAGGFLAVSLAYTAVTWAGFWMIWRRIGMERVPPVIAAICLLLAAAAGVDEWGPRSQMISFTLTALTLLWVEAYLRDRNRHLQWLPAVILVWANLHGGFVYGLAVVGLAAVAESILWGLDTREGAHRRRALGLWAVLLVSALAALVNPFTYKVYAIVAEVQFSAVQQSFIAEWQSPNFHMLAERALELLLILTAVGMALRRQRLWDGLIVAAAIYFALAAVRNGTIAAAMVTPVVAWSGAAAWERGRFRERFAAALQRRGHDVLILTAAGTLVVAAGTAGLMVNTLSGQTASTDANFPVMAADCLADNPGVGSRMLNAFDWGGYLIHRFSTSSSDTPPADRRVFVYGQATLMGNSLMQEIADVENAEPDWQSILARNQVDYVVERTDSAVTMALSVDPQWEEVYDDGFAVILVKRQVLARTPWSYSSASCRAGAPRAAA